MTESQRIEFTEILAAAAARSQPAYNYATISNDLFVIIWSYVRTVEIFTAYLVALGGGRIRGGQISWETFDKITALADPPLTEKKLFELAEWYFHPWLFRVLAECWKEQPNIISELEKRLDKHQISMDLVIIPLSTGSEGNLKRIESLLRFDEISPNLQDHDDLKQTALLKVLETIEKKNVIDHVPLPPYPLPLRSDIQRIWQEDVASVWQRECETVLGKLKAGLDTTDSALRGNVSLRTDHETEKRGARRRRAILRKREVEPHNEIGERLAAKRDLVHMARNRWGQRAAKAVEYVVIYGKKENEAAALANVPYQSLRRYISKLYKIGNQPV